MGFIFNNKHSGDMGVVFKSTDRTLLPAKRVAGRSLHGRGIRVFRAFMAHR